MKKIVAVFTLVAIVTIAGCLCAHADNAYGVTIRNTTTTSDGYFKYITGVAVNNSKTTYSTFGLTFDLIDASGDTVGNTCDSIMNFRPGQSWKFKALITEESATKYQLSGMEGY